MKQSGKPHNTWKNKDKIGKKEITQRLGVWVIIFYSHKIFFKSIASRVRKGTCLKERKRSQSDVLLWQLPQRCCTMRLFSTSSCAQPSATTILTPGLAAGSPSAPNLKLVSPLTMQYLLSKYLHSEYLLKSCSFSCLAFI